MDYLQTVIIIACFGYSFAQDANCDFARYVQQGQTYYIYSPNNPKNYTPGVQCRWIATCPLGYNCKLYCTLEIPASSSCSQDRVLISKSGDPTLSAAEKYCGRGTVNAVSTQQSISIGTFNAGWLISIIGGKFMCTLTAQPASSPGGTCSCGYKKTNRIVGGHETGVNEYPMMAAVVDSRIQQNKCGGVIIDNQYIMTAAHCIINYNIKDVRIVVGKHDVSNIGAAEGYSVVRFKIHPQFDASNYNYDIALIQVEPQIVYSSSVGPVCMPFKFTNSDLTGSLVTLLGWGTQFPGGPTSNVLQEVDVNVISWASCKESVPNLSTKQFCTYTHGKDACQDDSGGPVLYTDPATGLVFANGIISYGKSCASGSPGVNSNVMNSEMLQWVVGNTPGANYCRK